MSKIVKQMEYKALEDTFKDFIRGRQQQQEIIP